jgi:hypothetical protein
MFSISLRNENHTRRYSIVLRTGWGWEIKVEQEGRVTRHICCRDWHRVERTLAMFRLEVSRLTALGWRPFGRNEDVPT